MGLLFASTGPDKNPVTVVGTRASMGKNVKLNVSC